jgi:putative hydrolase of the HAD superfamily
MIRNLIFDMGNVLLDYNPKVCLDLYLKHEDDKKLLMRELFQGPEWVEADRGSINNTEMFEFISKRVPVRLHGALKQCIDGWQICMKPLPGAEPFLRAAKNAGYGIYLLSNANSSIYEYFPKFLPFEFFDGYVISSDVHLLKPDPAIYRYLFERYRLKPEECLFIDDRADNVAEAVNTGMKGVVFSGNFNEIKVKFSLGF